MNFFEIFTENCSKISEISLSMFSAYFQLYSRETHKRQFSIRFLPSISKYFVVCNYKSWYLLVVTKRRSKQKGSGTKKSRKSFSGSRASKSYQNVTWNVLLDLNISQFNPKSHYFSTARKLKSNILTSLWRPQNIVMRALFSCALLRRSIYWNKRN